MATVIPDDFMKKWTTWAEAMAKAWQGRRSGDQRSWLQEVKGDADVPYHHLTGAICLVLKGNIAFTSCVDNFEGFMPEGVATAIRNATGAASLITGLKTWLMLTKT